MEGFPQIPREHVAPTEEMLNDLAELYKILVTVPGLKFSIHSLTKPEAWGRLPRNYI